MRKFNYLRHKYGMRDDELSELTDEDQKKYEDAKVYSGVNETNGDE